MEEQYRRKIFETNEKYYFLSGRGGGGQSIFFRVPSQTPSVYVPPLL
jgi:hypothetical protein